MELPSSHEKAEPPFVEYRDVGVIKGVDTVAVFEFNDAWGKREVLYNKHNLELRIEQLKKTGQPSAEAERALAEWPK